MQPSRSAGALTAASFGLARAQPVVVDEIGLRLDEGNLVLDFRLRLPLSSAVRDALQRGVPIYFTAQAVLKEERWYWRDKRLQRAQRDWRLAYQPLTSTWRVGMGGLNPSFPSLDDALASVSRAAGWRVADVDLVSQLSPRDRHYVDFEYRLDTSQLPGPMQIGLTAQDDWNLVVQRRLPVTLTGS